MRIGFEFRKRGTFQLPSIAPQRAFELWQLQRLEEEKQLVKGHDVVRREKVGRDQSAGARGLGRWHCLLWSAVPSLPASVCLSLSLSGHRAHLFAT